MFQTNYTCHVLKRKHSVLLGIIWALAITALVAYGALALNSKTLANNLKGIDFYFLIAGIILSSIATILYFSVRFRIKIDGDDKRLTIVIKDPSLPEALYVSYPFQLKKQYTRAYVGRKVDMNELHLTIIDKKNEPLVTFSGALGAIYSVPKGFDYIDLMNDNERPKLVKAQLIYEAGKIVDIADNLSIAYNYIEKKTSNTINFN